MASIRLYIDEDSMHQPLIRALRACNIDVLTVNDTKTAGQSDQSQLQLASLKGRVLLCRQNIVALCNLHKAVLATGESRIRNP